MAQRELRNIPSVSSLATLLRDRGITVSDERSVSLAQSIQEDVRRAILEHPSVPASEALETRLARFDDWIVRSRYRRVINGTGIVVHTNLGRAPVSDDAARSMANAAASAVSLEVDPDSGHRGGRMDEVAGLLRELAGAESALVVNNNAAAILLALSALAAGRTVAVSRAEAVEIGGGFRIPDVLRQSGATLLEVGTTNRTYARDYRHPDVVGGVILKVHASNFAISGFVATPTIAELRGVADEQGTILIEDLGSGTLVDTSAFGVDHEPTVAESLAGGADIVTFSGDKLLGGPQAGIVAGRRDLVDRIAQHPLARAVRADKVTLAGVAATLRHYLRGDELNSIPVLRMLAIDVDTLRHRAAAIAERLRRQGIAVELLETTNFVGGGSLPGQALPGVAISLEAGWRTTSDLARRLRLHPDTPVFGRVERDRLLIELRTVAPADDETLSRVLIDVSGSTLRDCGNPESTD